MENAKESKKYDWLDFLNDEQSKNFYDLRKYANEWIYGIPKEGLRYGVVYATFNYDLFDWTKLNRVIDPRLVQDKERVLNENNLFMTFPAAVMYDRKSDKLKVGDAQHRIVGSKNTNKPVFFLLLPEYFEESHISDIQSDAKRWQGWNFLGGFAREGNENYIAAQDFLIEINEPLEKQYGLVRPVDFDERVKDGGLYLVYKEMGFGGKDKKGGNVPKAYSPANLFAAAAINDTGFSKTFRDGKWIADERVFDHCRLVFPLVTRAAETLGPRITVGSTFRTFIVGVSTVVEQEGFDRKKFVETMEKKPDSFIFTGRLAACIGAFNEIFKSTKGFEGFKQYWRYPWLPKKKGDTKKENE